jgi:hypothetical protein
MGLAALAALTSCDIGSDSNAANLAGPPVRVLGTSFEAEGGLVPADGSIRITFDRYLLPITVTRQAFMVLDPSNKPIEGLKTVYDPITRSVSLFGRDGPGVSWLTPEAPYKLYLPIPEDPASNITGLRAIDRATLGNDQVLIRAFRASSQTGKVSRERDVEFCADILPLFVTKCSSERCHGPAGAAAGLALSSDELVLATALNRVAQGASLTGRPNTAETSSSRFGANMLLIKPGDPGSSWLLYKTELAELPTSEPMASATRRCASAPSVREPLRAQVPAFVNAAPEERARLGSFILGEAMPHAPGALAPSPDAAALPPDPSPLTLEERDRLRLWIARGAETRACTDCESVPSR